MKLIYSLVLTLMVGTCLAQCPDPSKFCVEAEDKKWNYNSQSKSAAFEKGKDYTMSFVAYRAQAYRIGVCSMLLDEKDVAFKVYTKVTEKNDSTGRYEKVKKYLFRNSENDMRQSCLIAGENTATIFVELKVPAGKSEKKKNEIQDLVCVGVLIEQSQNSAAGF